MDCCREVVMSVLNMIEVPKEPSAAIVIGSLETVPWDRLEGARVEPQVVLAFPQ